MGTSTTLLDLTIQVRNLSPRTTLSDLNNFFSYCGTVDKIQFLRPKTEAGSQSALVTFRQPYAFQTALLLNNAILVEQPICILPAGVVQIPIISDHEDDSESETKLHQPKKEKELIAAVHGTMQQIGGAAEQAAGRISVWVTDVVEKASKFASDLHLGTTKRDNPNSRKQK